MNGVYLRETPAEEFACLLAERVQRAGLADAADFKARHDWYLKLAPLVSERIKLLTEVEGMVRFLFLDSVTPDETARAKVLDKDPDLARRALQAALEALESVPEGNWDVAHIETAMADLPERIEAKPRLAYQPLRVAITGSVVSPPLNDSMELLGREKTLARIKALL